MPREMGGLHLSALSPLSALGCFVFSLRLIYSLSVIQTMMSCTPVNMTRRTLRCCSLYTHGKFTPYAICGMVRAKVRPSRSPPPHLTQRVLDRYR